MWGSPLDTPWRVLEQGAGQLRLEILYGRKWLGQCICNHLQSFLGSTSCLQHVFATLKSGFEGPRAGFCLERLGDTSVSGKKQPWRPKYLSVTSSPHPVPQLPRARAHPRRRRVGGRLGHLRVDAGGASRCVARAWREPREAEG